MRSHLVFALLLAACASPSGAPRQYAQGIPPIRTMPPAWDSPTTRDAPHTTGMPGYAGPLEGMPRSPYGRVLPQTPETRREPGIWAGDLPKADDDSENARRFREIVSQLPLPAMPTDSEYTWSLLCSAKAYGSLALAVGGTPESVEIMAQRIHKWSSQERVCVIARLYAACVVAADFENGAVRKKYINPAEVHVAPESMLRLKDMAKKFLDSSCKDVALSKDAQTLYTRARERIKAFTRVTQNREEE